MSGGSENHKRYDLEGGGYLLLSYNAGDDRTAHVVTERFQVLARTFKPDDDPESLQKTLRFEFNWNGYWNIEVHYVQPKGGNH